jgi:hypothetical protein
MFSACRHIKSDGIRCKSPAMRSCDFCYFHAKLHESTRGTTRRKLAFSQIEDSASINSAVVRTLNALLSKTIDAKQAGLILYGIQIVAKKVDDYRGSPRDTVRDISRSKQGDELAPQLCVPERGYGKPTEDCSECAHRDTCTHLKPRENRTAGTQSSHANTSNGIAKTLTAASADDQSPQSSGKHPIKIPDVINEANFQQVIDSMSPITLLKTYLKLMPTGSPGS